jgi:PAS domain S-box-containing protein
MIKKAINILFFLFAIIAIVQSKTVVKVGAFNFYPAIFRDVDGEIKGFYVEALNEFGKKEDIEFVYIYGSWNEGLKRIKTGEVDLLTSVAITEERLQFMDFSDIPLLTVWSEVYVKSKTNIQGILDLNGKTIAVMKSDYNALYFKQFAEKFSITCYFDETTDFDEVFKLTIDGKVEAGIVNNTFGAAKSFEYGLVSSGIAFNPFDIYFAVKKGTNQQLLQLLNVSLHSWKHDKNSVFNTSRQKWSHGNVGVIEVFPKWLQKAVYLSLFLVLLFIIFIALLRYKIKLETEKVREKENTFRKLFEDSSDAILLLNKAGVFVDCNEATLDLVKMTREQFLFKSPIVFSPTNQPDGQKSEVKAPIVIEAAYEKGISRFDWTLINSLGVEFIVEVTLMPIKVKGELMLYNTWRNITERKLAELYIYNKNQEYEALNEELKETNQHLCKAKEKAEESDRLKTAFLQNMSHEIRTPMNAIMGFSSLLIQNYGNKPKLEHFSKIINQRCSDLLDIINDILDISKIESGQLSVSIEQCNIIELFDELNLFFKEYQKRIEKQHIKFSIKYLSDKSYSIVQTDNLKLKQILINLIGNAFKFTDDGSIECGCRLENKDFVFYVSDTGIGIPLDKHNSIFDRFSQLNHSSLKNIGGTGLGLSIAKGLTGLLGGEMWLESETEKGTTFYFSIPFIEYNILNNKSTGKDEINELNFQNKTVLIVEDDIYNAEYLKEILSDKGFKIIITEYGKKAIDIVESQPVDLVLMDIRLPDMSGYDATRIILKSNPSIKIIAQTAYAAQDEFKKALEAGCIDYISKPTKIELLMSLISKCLIVNTK